MAGQVNIAMNKKRSICEKEVRAIFRDWLYEASLSGVSPEKAEFADFYLRLSHRYPQCICFKPSACVTHWVHLWFDQEIDKIVRK